MKRSLRSVLAVLALCAAATASSGAASPAAFHLVLRKAVPAADGTVAAAPKAIELHFSQEPQIRGTSIRLVSASDQEIAVGDAAQDAADGTIVRAAVTGAVAPGAYRVVWRTMARDGHVIRGEYRFTLKAST